jgi:UTP:GlnB (protein PII) uridylyltransferase
MESDGGPATDATEPILPAGFVDAFARSMPPRYTVLFDPHSIRRHAAIAHRRGERPAFAEIWRLLPDGSAALAVVARDQPGLLSAIAATLVSHRLDVITALVFSRVTDGGEKEAVDLVWIRRSGASDTAPINAEDATSIAEVLGAILAGRISVAEIAGRAPARDDGGSGPVVRFDEVDEDGHAVLLVETTDRPALLLTITFEVFQQGAEIARSLVRTAGHRVLNRFVLTEFGGAPLSSERRAQIQSAVYSALALGSSHTSAIGIHG